MGKSMNSECTEPGGSSSFLPHIIQVISMTALLGDGICFISYSDIKEVCLLNILNGKRQPYLHNCRWILGFMATRSLLQESSQALSFTTEFGIPALITAQP